MPVSDPAGTTVLSLSRAEQWVVHHVLLDSIGLANGEADDPSEPSEPVDATQESLGVIEKIEAGQFEFTSSELAFIRRTCGAHARTTEATADRNLASAVAERVESALRDVSASRVE